MADDNLYRALLALVGVETRDELKEMESILRLSHVPEENRSVMLDAIHALLDHAPKLTPVPRYPMCDDQPAQIDCRITNCRFHNNQGACTNVSPAITLNENQKFVCWSCDLREDI